MLTMPVQVGILHPKYSPNTTPLNKPKLATPVESEGETPVAAKTE